MKKTEVQVGKVYAVKVSGVLAPVMLTNICQYGGWYGINVRTKKDVHIRSAQRLRVQLEKTAEGKWKPIGSRL